MRHAIVVASLLLSAAGCSLWQPAAVDEPALHVLDAKPALTSVTRRDQVLAVSPLRAAAGFDSTAMVYVQSPYVVGHYATHRWADAPARMLGPLLLRALDDGGGFRAVVQSSSGLPAELRLDTELMLMRHSFLVRPSRIELTLRAQLVDVQSRGVLATRYVEVSQDAPSDDAPGGVTAANAAVARALALVAAFCVEVSGDVRPRAPARP